MSAAGSDDTDHPATTEPPPPPVVTQRNDSVLKRSSAEVSIMMMLRIPPTSPPPPTLSVSSPPVSSSLPCPLCSPSASPPSCVTLEHVDYPVTSRSTPQTNLSTTSDLSAAAATTPKTATATATSATSSSSISSLSASSSTGMATKMTMMMTMMSPPTSSARRSTASVQNWFQAKLDVLGIESVYSRYIISLLLQQDNYHCSADGDLPSSPDCSHGIGGGSEGTACSHHHQHHHHHHRQCATANNNNNNNNNNAGEQSRNTAAVENKNAAGQGNNKWGSGGGNGIGGAGNGRRQRSAGRRDRQQPLSAEQRKKREAVGCLLEICDDILAGDIEDLIEELMLRLKQVDNERSSTTQPVISLPSANNNNNNNNDNPTETNVRQDPAEQYYAAFPALSSDSKISAQPQISQMSQVSGNDTSNVWKKKQQQQQSQKLAATLSTQTDNSVNLESVPARGRQSNAVSRRRRGCLSQTGNKENLHKPPFTLRGKEDRGSRYGSHSNRLRSGRGRSSRSLVSDTSQKFFHSSPRQSCSRSVGTRRYGGGVGGSGGGGGGNAPMSSEGDHCFSVENILKDILRTTNKNSQSEKGCHEQPYYSYSVGDHLYVSKIESGINEGDETSNLKEKGFQEDSKWYEVSFLENPPTSHNKGIPLVSTASSISNIGLRSDERSCVRLYHRHSYPPPSPRSAVTLENIEEKEILQKFSSCLGPHADKDLKNKNRASTSVANTIKKNTAPDGTDHMYAATKRVVDTSVRSLLDCSPEEILPSSAQSPSEELERSLHLLSGCTPQNDLYGCNPSFLNGSMITGGTFGPAADDLFSYDWSASLIKAVSPVVTSPTTPVSSPSSSTSLSLLDVSYLTNMADREKGTLDKKQREAARNRALCLISDDFGSHIPNISSLLESPCKLVAEIKTSRRGNFTHDPYVFVSNSRSSVAEDEFFNLSVTPTPSHGAVGQALYNATNYRPWSYALVEERIVSEVQRSDILAQNECLSQVWDVNVQRRVVPNSHTNINYSKHIPNLEPSPTFLLHSRYKLSTPRVTPFTFFFSSVFNTSPPAITDNETHKSASDTSEKALPAILSSTESTRSCESSNSIKTVKQDDLLSTACSDTHQIPDDSSSASPSSSPNVKLALTMTTTVVSSSHSVISSVSSGTSSSSSSPLPQEPPPKDDKKATPNRILVPSTNSAFRRVIPDKNKPIVVVQRRETIPPEDEEVMRQVNRISPRESLFFSPRSHFKPIKSPIPMSDTLEHSLLNSVTAGVNTVVKASDIVAPPTEMITSPRLYQPQDLFGGHTASHSPYQQFKPENYKDDGEEIRESFIPSFKILNDRDKFVQTGSSEENLDIDLEKLAYDVCTENVEAESVLFPKIAKARSTDSAQRTDNFVSMWNQSNRLPDLSGWSREEPEKDAKPAYLNTWNSDRPSRWSPATANGRWSSALSSPTSSLCSLEHRPYAFSRDPFWYTSAGTMSAVRGDAWLSSSSGTPNSRLSTPCTASAGPQSNVLCKTKTKKEISPTEACISPGLVSEEENSLWSASSINWTINSAPSFYLRANPRLWDSEEGCGETVVDEADCKLLSPGIDNKLLTPDNLTQASSSQSIWPNKIWEQESYVHQNEAFSIGLKSALSAANSFAQRDTKLSTEEEPVPENQEGSCSHRFNSNIWANPNPKIWPLPMITHSSSSSTSASLAASPSSAPSPPLSHPPTSNDPLLDLVCGPTCAQTAGASKPCQHQLLRKIWDHKDPTDNSTSHGDSGETTKNSPHQSYGAKENQPLLMNSEQTRSSHELPPFGNARQLASVSVTPPGVRTQSSNHQKPPAKILSLGPPPLVPLPSAAVYSSELEKEWLSGETSCSSSAVSLQRAKIQREKSRSCKKPCSFFLEGNCWRQECKYAHDICTITCRFWEEGECFKGDTCPFLHGYSFESVRPSLDSSSSDSFKRRAEASPSITATIHTSSVAHPSAPPEEFEKECRSLTQSKALLSDRISTGKADPRDGIIPTSIATDVLSQGLADETTTTNTTTTTTTTPGCSGSDTPPNTAADPSCNRRGSGDQGVSSTAPPSTLSSSSSPPPSAS